MRNSTTKKLVMSGACIALGIVLSLAFHAVPKVGIVFLPMHIPVLLCGLACGWQYGLAVGVILPLLSHLITGMPPVAFLPGMVCELAVYGLLTGIMSRVIYMKNQLAALYIQLVTAMIAGRIVYGIINALIFQAGGSYSFSVWVTGAFVTALPGIIIQLVLIPAIVIALRRARLIDNNA